MRRDRLMATVMSGAGGVLLATGLLVVATPVFAAPSSPAPSGSVAAAPAAGQPVCTINRSGLFGISGMVAKADGYVVVNDSQQVNTNAKIFFFDQTCKYKNQIGYAGNGAYDPEDLALGKDGTLWVADIGDNSKNTGGSGNRRESVALWSVAPGATRTVIHRFAYPDGRHDAEALVLNGDDTPIFVTKETDQLGAAAGLYAPAAPMQNNNTAPVALKRVGEVKPPATDTPNPLSVGGRQVFTGGATSPDRKKVVLRTYADAFEWDVPDGDVIKALTTGKPRITGLPNEPQGEAISYSADGQAFLTVSDTEESNPAVQVLRYTPAVAQASPKAARTGGSKDSGEAPFMVQDLMYVVAAVGGLGLVLVIAGVIGIRQSRIARRRAAALAGARGARGKATVGGVKMIEGPKPALDESSGERSGNIYGRSADGEDSGAIRGRAAEDSGAIRTRSREDSGNVYGRPTGGVYGKPGAGGGVSGEAGGVYGKPPTGGRGGGGVYGASGGGSGVYGRPAGPRPDDAGNAPGGRLSEGYGRTPGEGRWR